MVFQISVGIPISPYWQTYEVEIVQKLQWDIEVKKKLSCPSYVHNDISMMSFQLAIIVFFYHYYVHFIYSDRLEIKMLQNQTYLLHIWIFSLILAPAADGQNTIYDKCDGFNFVIVNLPLLYCNIHLSPGNVVYVCIYPSWFDTQEHFMCRRTANYWQNSSCHRFITNLVRSHHFAYFTVTTMTKVSLDHMSNGLIHILCKTVDSILDLTMGNPVCII
jgi:hypothetical protein